MAKTKEANAGTVYQKQRANVYTMMLIVTFLALTFGSFVMFRAMDGYRNDKGEIQFGPTAQAH